MADLSASIAEAISNSLSPHGPQRRNAEAFLAQHAASTAELPILLLRFISSESAALHIRQAAAVFFKNTTSRVYAADEGPSPLMPAYDHVKASIIDLMLASPTSVRLQLGAVLSTIADHDYPQNWPRLVPALTEKVAALMVPAENVQPPTKLISVINWPLLTAVLETLQTVFDRYPERMRSDPLFTEINYSLLHSQEHVLALFQLIAKVIDDDFASQDSKLVVAVLRCAKVLIRIFYCLSWQDLPAYFEDHLRQYMAELRKFLAFFSEAVDSLSNDEPGPLDNVHASVMEVANLYATKFDEDFRPFLPQFISDAWALLIRRGSTPRFDIVVTTGIKFLSSVARSPDFHLFKESSTLGEICNRIVIPNIEIRDEDVEMFEDEPREYVRQDLEGSDSGTRRRGAVELVKALCVHYEQQVTDIFSSYVQSISSPQTDWRKRDTAIYLVVALGWKSGTLMRGISETSSLINIVQFFTSFVLGPLKEDAKNASAIESPILTADLIKFVIAFRHHLPIEGCKEAMTVCGNLIAAPLVVVRTYAAACIERILTMRDSEAGGGAAVARNGSVRGKSALRITKEDMVPLLPSILPNVVSAVKSAGRPDEYLMRLILRLCTVCKDGMSPYVEAVLKVLVELLVAVISNPANPLFNHYLFECLAALIRFNANATTVGTFESVLMQPMCDILIGDVTEFGPYVFQLFSQLMNAHEGALPGQYKTFMGPTLNPAMWERRAYIAGMVLYIEMYIRNAKEQLVSDGQMEATLGVFQKLIASKATDHYGLHLVSVIFEVFDLQILRGYIRAIFNALMVRLSRAKTPKYVNYLLSALSTFVLRFGADEMRRGLNEVDGQVFAMLLKQVWVPDVVKIRPTRQRKLCSLALTEVACGSKLCVEEPFVQMWPDIVNANVALIEGIVLEDADADDLIGGGEEDEEDMSVLLGAAETYSATVSELKWGISVLGRPSPLVQGKDTKVVLYTKLTDFLEKMPSFKSLFEKKVDPQAQKAFSNYVALAPGR